MSNYEEKIKALTHFSIKDCIQISKELVPTEHKEQPWEILNHGTGLLQNSNELHAYIAAYGEMHAIKCRAAFQNFPFQDITHKYEIIDWGCGQGLATMALIEILKERKIYSLLNKITLVEPSKIALQRALFNVSKVTNQAVTLEHYNNFLPSTDTKVQTIDKIDSNNIITIHLFSNILDIPTIDLEKLALMISKTGYYHYILCMGPLNRNHKRIDQFCAYFKPTNYFSKINAPIFQYTTDSHHPYSCYTKCFKFTTKDFIWEPEKIIHATIYDNKNLYFSNEDYHKLSPTINKHITDTYELLCKCIKQKDIVFIQPNINGDQPDFIIVRKDVGIILLNIYTGNISDLINNVNNSTYSTPTDKINKYKNNLIQLHIRTLQEKSIGNRNYYSIIKSVIIFPNIDTNQVTKALEKADTKYINLIGQDQLNSIKLKQKIDNQLFKIYNQSLFDNELYNFLLHRIQPRWHYYHEGRNIQLTKPQLILSKSEERPRRKIKGVAGSGKTQVLAQRAVNASLRTGEKVLVLTFNITLVNYIRYRMSQVYADFSWNQFTIINYHQFFKSQAINYNLKYTNESFDESNFFETVKDTTTKYQAILIDEIQDYSTEWIETITKYFLAEDGEFVVFGDAKQNVYHKKLDDLQEIRTVGIPGQWNNSLNQGFRFNNLKFTTLATNFQKVFFPHQSCDIVFNDPQFDFDEKNCTYYKSEDIIDNKTLCHYCTLISKKYKIDYKNIVILFQYRETLREIDFILRKEKGLLTTTTVETKEEEAIIRRQSMYYDDEIKKIRRTKKLHFSMENDNIKLSTIHSFKGWEAHTIILLLEAKQVDTDNKDNPELIYTAITRAKNNLFIMNRDNETYHNFFKQNINEN